MADKLRVAVIGVGHLGQHHARNYFENDRCTLIGVCDANEKQAQKIARSYRTDAFTDFRELLGKVDAVSIATPTVAHYEIASTMLESGVHCMVEKPICTTVVEAAKLTALARRKRLVLQVGHIEHFNVAVQKLKEMLTRVRFIEVHRQGPFDPRVKDVGVVMDLMIHDVDIILRIVNSPIKRIEAIGVPILTEKEDIANARLYFENGCIANVTVSRVTPKPLRKLRLFQDDAYISLDYRNQKMEVFRRREVDGPVKPGEPRYYIESKRLRIKRQEPLKLELDHFMECVENQILDPATTGEQAMEALDVVIKITEQIRAAEGKLKAGDPTLNELLAADQSS